MGALQSKLCSTDNFHKDATVQQDSSCCSHCITTATDGAMSVAKFAGVACQQAAFCLLQLATCVSVFGPSSTQPEAQYVYKNSSAVSSGVLQGLYAPPIPLTMDCPYTLLDGVGSSKRSTLAKQLAITVWNGGYIQRPASTMQVSPSNDL